MAARSRRREWVASPRSAAPHPPSSSLARTSDGDKLWAGHHRELRTDYRPGYKATTVTAGGDTEVGGRDQKTILWSSNVQTLFRNSKQTIRTPPEGRTGGGGLLFWLTMSVRFLKIQLQTKVLCRRVPPVHVRGIGLVFCVDWLSSQFEYFGRAGAGPERSSSNMSRSPHLRPEMAWSLVCHNFDINAQFSEKSPTRPICLLNWKGV